MSMGIMKNGAYQKCAGMTQSGELIMGASTIRKGTSQSVTISAGYFTTTVGITFDEPMPDADYDVILYNTQGIGSMWTDFIPCVKNKTKNGFDVQFNTLNNTPVTGQTITCNISYTAFKLFTVEGLEDLENDVEDLKAVNTATVTLKPTDNSAEELTLFFAKQGNVVTFSGLVAANWTGTLKTNWQSIGTVPAGFRPSHPVLMYLGQPTMTGKVGITFGIDGVVTQFNHSATTAGLGWEKSLNGSWIIE